MVDDAQLYGARDRFAALRGEDGYMVLLDLWQKGRWKFADPALAYVWEHLATGLELQTALEVAAKDWVPVERLRQDVGKLVPGLRRAGVLSPRPTQRGRFMRPFADGQPPAGRRVAATAEDEVRSARYVAAAVVGFATAMMLMLLPPRATWRVMYASRRLRRQRPTVESTKQLVATVSWVSKPYPGWRDCFEISTGAYFAGVLLGKAPHWCLGARLRPLARHAWLEVDRVAVDHEDQAWKDYVAMIRV